MVFCEFMSIKAILSLLADGKIHSGEELGESLGISRTAVWKQLKKIMELQIPIETVLRKGYRLLSPVDFLDDSEIIGNLDSAASPLLAALKVYDTVTSTNALALDEAPVFDDKALVYIAERQTDGKGRLGREWHSPYAQNLYFSVSWQFSGGAAALQGLSLSVGVVIADTLNSLGASDVQLKWPNDIWLGGKKLGGILIELKGDLSGPCTAVIGVGINLGMTKAEEDVISQSWTSLALEGVNYPSRSVVMAALLNKMLPFLAAYQREQFSAIKDRWMSYAAFLGESVCLLTVDANISGVFVGVTEEGAILIENGAERQTFYGGEISLRPI